MLSCPPPPSPHLHFHRQPHSTIVSSSLRHQLNHSHNPTPDAVIRTHNSKTTSFLLHHTTAAAITTTTTTNSNKTKNPSQGNENERQQHRDFIRPNDNNATIRQLIIPPQEKLNIQEMSLVSKRAPMYPGSIYTNSPPSLQSVLRTRNDTQHPENDDDDEDEEAMIIRALEIRRKVRAGFQGSNEKGEIWDYVFDELVNRLSEFIDHVMIEAAALKKLPEFEDSTFNVRAKVVIEDSNVVPLVRWLKHNNLSYPKIAKLITMSKRNLESIRQLVEWLKSIHVNGEF